MGERKLLTRIFRRKQAAARAARRVCSQKGNAASRDIQKKEKAAGKDIHRKEMLPGGLFTERKSGQQGYS